MEHVIQVFDATGTQKISTNVCLKLNELNLNVFVELHSDYKLGLFHVFLLVHSQHNLDNAMRKLYSPHLFEGPGFFRKQQAFISMVGNISWGIAPKKKHKLMLHVGNIFTYISSCSCGHFLGKSSTTMEHHGFTLCNSIS